MYRGRALVGDRRQYVLFFALVAAVTVAGFAVARSRVGDGRGRDVLAAVPADSWLVVTVDVAALRASPLAKPLVGGGAGDLAGLGPLPDACGFDPVPRLRQLAVASPEGGERGDFGVALDGDLTRAELSRCAEKIIGARGGSASTTQRGSFSVVENASDAKRTRMAYRDGGPFLVGRGGWVDAMIDAFGGKRATLSSNAQHMALRSSLAAAAGAPPTAMLTAVLPKALRERLKSEMNDEVGTVGAGAPTDKPGADRAYAAVLAVEAAGVALTDKGGGQTGLTAELRCEAPEACAEVKRLIDRKRADFAKGFAARLLGLSPLLDSMTVSTQGVSLSLSAHASSAELADALGRLLDLRRSPSPPVGVGAPTDKPGTARPEDAGH